MGKSGGQVSQQKGTFVAKEEADLSKSLLLAI